MKTEINNALKWWNKLTYCQQNEISTKYYMFKNIPYISPNCLVVSEIISIWKLKKNNII